jgi:hypothetical protein
MLLTLPASSYHGVKTATPYQLWPHGDPGSGELMLPLCGLRPSPGFIQICLMLCCGSPV